jgi:hypothetical protein
MSDENRKTYMEYARIMLFRPLNLIGMCLFFYFSFDLLLNDYAWERTIFGAFLAMAGLFMPLLRFLPEKFKRRG